MFNIVVNLNWGTLLSSTEADTYTHSSRFI